MGDNPFDRGVAIVAGGAGGIGSAVSLALAAAGSDVALTYRSRREAADGIVDEIGRLGRTAIARQVDHCDPAAIKAFVAEAADQFGTIHSVIYAAGPALPHKFVNAISPEDWRAVVEGDVISAFHLVWATLPHLRKNGGGAYLAVTTAATKRTPLRDICSAAPKAAIEMLFRGIALEEGRYGIRANCVAPGFIDAGLGAELIGREDLGDWTEALRKSLPMKRFGEAVDVARAALFLLSPEARYVTGQSLAVDGGLQL